MIDVSIKQKRHSERHRGLSLDRDEVESLVLMSTGTVENSELLSVDGHSDGSHDPQDRLSGVFEMQQTGNCESVVVDISNCALKEPQR